MVKIQVRMLVAQWQPHCCRPDAFYCIAELLSELLYLFTIMDNINAYCGLSYCFWSPIYRLQYVQQNKVFKQWTKHSQRWTFLFWGLRKAHTTCTKLNFWITGTFLARDTINISVTGITFSKCMQVHHLHDWASK